jgi:hypothetical protein
MTTALKAVMTKIKRSKILGLAQQSSSPNLD